MGIDPTPSSSLIKNSIATEESRLRGRYLPPSIVAKVMRHGSFVGDTVKSFAKIDRGMEYARQLVLEYEEQGRSFPSGMVIIAEELTAGKGRFKRQWHAPPGGIWMTLVLANTLLPESTRLYPLAAGVACCEAVHHYVPEARLKWVNDVHVHGRKICGVLAESFIGRRFGEEYVLIGAGINVNNEKFPAELVNLADSIKRLTGRTVEIDFFVARLLAKFVWNIGLLHHVEETRLAETGAAGSQDEDHPLLQRWRQLSDTIGRRVSFGYDVQRQPQYEAQVLDLDRSGGLLLRNIKDNSTIVECSGEILYLD